jgi:AraC-like DNA-binding protein
MRYREIKPRQSLRGFVECYWTLEGDGKDTSLTAEPILPDGCVELILNCDEPFLEIKDNGERLKQPMHFVVGQMTRPLTITPTGTVHLIGIRFHPGGTMPFFKQPIYEITNRTIELVDVDSTLARQLADALSSSGSWARRINAIELCLAQRIQTFTGDDRLVPLTANIIRLNGRVRIDSLAGAAGVSGRQLERRFLQEVGIGPKLFCRILRFQQVFRAVAEDSTSWADIALTCGYYDQAHLIRDFHEFAHQTPAVLLSQHSRLTEAFTRRDRS